MVISSYKGENILLYIAQRLLPVVTDIDDM